MLDENLFVESALSRIEILLEIMLLEQSRVRVWHLAYFFVGLMTLGVVWIAWLVHYVVASKKNSQIDSQIKNLRYEIDWHCMSEDNRYGQES